MTLLETFFSILSPQKNAGDRAEDDRPQGALNNMLTMTKEAPQDKVIESLFLAANPTDARRAKAWLSNRIAAASKLPPDQIITETVDVTPALAELLLREYNTDNRPIRSKRVALYAQQMRDGQWKLTAEMVSLARCGLLNNGQHRLRAIIEAGVTVKMRMAFGEARDVFDVLDTGAVRGGGDSLHIKGYKNTNLLASSARIYRIITSSTPNRNLALTNTEVLAVLEAHPRLETATTWGARVAYRLKASGSALTAAFYLISERSASARRLDAFIESLATGTELRSRDPILVLREGLLSRQLEVARDGTGKNAMVTAAVILAWNRWVRGKTCSGHGALRWDTTTPFPMPE